MISLYLYKNKKPYLISAIPGMFYMFIISAYLLGAKIGFNIPQTISNVIGIVLAFIYLGLIMRAGKKMENQGERLSA